ncbi:hypothetical protein CEXT_691021 [Caerostris extrusa]|uniref:Uncharacterized protein n=1 Tax=Caerostris extrusa TaxID=172846 RepID=A0AAV4MB35_CAEEX|nr:hypothetical protein CEXT_691021 [Caerostris extrusa]
MFYTPECFPAPRYGAIIPVKWISIDTKDDLSLDKDEIVCKVRKTTAARLGSLFFSPSTVSDSLEDVADPRSGRKTIVKDDLHVYCDVSEDCSPP